MGNRYRKRVIESQSAAAVRKDMDQMFRNMSDYFTGALEQLMYQLGGTMTLQAAMTEYLETKDKGATDQLKAIVEANRIKFEAEQAAKKEEAAKLKAQKEQEQKDMAEAEANAPQVVQHTHTPEELKAAYQQAIDYGQAPYDPTAPCNIAAHEKAKLEQTGAYAPDVTPATPDLDMSVVAPEPSQDA